MMTRYSYYKSKANPTFRRDVEQTLIASETGNMRFSYLGMTARLYLRKVESRARLCPQIRRVEHVNPLWRTRIGFPHNGMVDMRTIILKACLSASDGSSHFKDSINPCKVIIPIAIALTSLPRLKWVGVVNRPENQGIHFGLYPYRCSEWSSLS
jgi:hypothetical protein